jgi:hypothetical protein
MKLLYTHSQSVTQAYANGVDSNISVPARFKIARKRIMQIKRIKCSEVVVQHIHSPFTHWRGKKKRERKKKSPARSWPSVHAKCV